jgi:GTP cyclohydrolase II
MNHRPQKLQALSQPATADDELAAIRVDRAQTEFKHGRAVVVTTEPGGPVLLAAAVETLAAARLQWLAAAGAPLRLLLTADRLRAMGWAQAAGPSSLTLGTPASVDRLQRLAAVLPGSVPTVEQADFASAHAASPAMQAALAIAKRARLVPALLVAELPATALPALEQAQLLQVSAADVAALTQPTLDGRPRLLRRVSDAHVPIAAHEDCTLVLFREINGDAEHVAIIVGQPDLNQPVAVRLHSACLTGDLLGSLRCDCGDQLRRGVEHLAEAGGVLLYLAQEGRGTGLANKLRAYRLQDAGLDTIDADHYLGFSADERDFAPAVAMLQELGIARIHLLTNNPHKIEFMRRGGLEVVERVALLAPVNRHNARYVQTKHERAGHLANGHDTEA